MWNEDSKIWVVDDYHIIEQTPHEKGYELSRLSA